MPRSAPEMPLEQSLYSLGRYGSSRMGLHTWHGIRPFASFSPVPEPDNMIAPNHILGGAVWAIIERLIAVGLGEYGFRKQLHETVSSDPLREGIRIFKRFIELRGGPVSIAGIESEVALPNMFVHLRWHLRLPPPT